MTYSHKEITPKGHTYLIHKLKGKIVQMNYNTLEIFDVHISTPNGIETIKSVASGLRGYNLDITNEFKIAISEHGIKYLRSIT